MIFIAEIGAVPETNTGPVMRYLLRMNDNAEESKGMTLSYNSESNNAAIGYQYSMRFLTIEKFEEFFKMFLDEVDRWKQKMQLYMQGTLPNGEEAVAASDVPASSPTVSNSASADVPPEFMIGA
jgi:hypothetical protein